MKGNELLHLTDDDYIVSIVDDFEVKTTPYDKEERMFVHKGQLFQVAYCYDGSFNKEFVYAKDVNGRVYKFSTRFLLQNFEVYDAEKLGLSDDWQMKLEDAQKPQLKPGEVIVNVDWLGTFYNITADLSGEFAEMAYSRQDTFDMFKDWAKEFEKKYGHKDWDDDSLSYLETLEQFEEDKVFDLRAKDFKWDDQAIINLQYIQNANCCPEEEFISNPQSDLNRRLAMKFTMYERDNKIDYDNPDQNDWESTITEWLSKNKR